MTDTTEQRWTPSPTAGIRHPERCWFVGCAGWSIPAEHGEQFPTADDGSTHLERYAKRLNAVEINSSFYRAHRPATYAKWAASVPVHFRFAVKLSRQITHVRRLKDPNDLLVSFLEEINHLGAKLGPILVQLPPSLKFDSQIAAGFFDALRSRFEGDVVCEPRHISWFHPAVEALLCQFRIARVAADPAVPVPEAAQPGGWDGLRYYRLHGSPQTYYSDYPEAQLQEQAKKMTDVAASGIRVWCIFDNTALGNATPNALRVTRLLSDTVDAVPNQ
jgi:uncharacterized protein YecE (DUF72 family)